jgi:hypothetical protein
MEPRCPDCGCRVQDHNNVNRVGLGDEERSLAHCGRCGLCWRCSSEFTELVRRRLEEGHSGSGLLTSTLTS